MNVLQKIKHYYKLAYRMGHFPSIWEIVYTKKPVLAYYGFLGDGNIGDELVYESAKKMFHSCLLVPFHRYKPISLRLYEKRLIKRTRGIVIGGGTLISNNNDQTKYLLKLKERALSNYIHGTGLKKIIGDEWLLILNRSKIFGGVRGYLSTNIANQYKLNLSVVGDAVFSLFDNNNKIKNSYKRILFNYGSHIYYEESTRARNIINEFLNKLIRQGYEVSFLPFHKIDLEIGQKLINKNNKNTKIKLLNIPHDFQEIQNIFSTADYAIGERLHFNIMAVLSNCPFFSINYDYKHNDFLNSLSLTHCGRQPNEMSSELLSYNFDNRNELFNWGEINAQLNNYKIMQIEEAKKFLMDVTKFTNFLTKN